jgi:hypothetical protein
MKQKKWKLTTNETSECFGTNKYCVGDPDLYYFELDNGPTGGEYHHWKCMKCGLIMLMVDRQINFCLD